LRISLTKDEVKSRFEGEKAPLPSTFETPEYLERKTSVTTQYPDYETNIPPYDGTSDATSTASTRPTAKTTVGKMPESVDIISWDKAIDKKVKSTDAKDLGKVQSITKDYVQTKVGTVSKNYYYIPKYYMQGYDGDHIWISLTKDEVKSKLEGEKHPPASTVETPEYLERRITITKQYPDFETNIPTYAGGGTSAAATTTAADSVPMPWDKIIHRKVKSSDNEDMGKVESVAPSYVEVKGGSVHKKRYFIPKYYVQSFDGEHICTSLTKDVMKDRFERDSPPTESEFQTKEYVEHRRKVDSTYPQFSHTGVLTPLKVI
jgi:hypothetical protein